MTLRSLLRARWWVLCLLCLVAAQGCSLGSGAIGLVLISLVALFELAGLIRSKSLHGQRTIHGLVLGFSLAAAAIVSAVHIELAKAARLQADVVARAVLEHKAAHGTFPPHSAALQKVPPDRTAPERIQYHLIEGKPNLVYPSTFIAFSAWTFDFDRGDWVYLAD